MDDPDSELAKLSAKIDSLKTRRARAEAKLDSATAARDRAVKELAEFKAKDVKAAAALRDKLDAESTKAIRSGEEELNGI